MELTAFDSDTVLTDFLTKYLDNELERGEKGAFEEYLEQNEKEREFARKVSQGKKALNWFASQLEEDESLNSELTAGTAFGAEK